MTAPAWTFAADRSGTDALMEMLDHGIRHLPVLDAGARAASACSTTST